MGWLTGWCATFSFHFILYERMIEMPFLPNDTIQIVFFFFSFFIKQYQKFEDIGIEYPECYSLGVFSFHHSLCPFFITLIMFCLRIFANKHSKHVFYILIDLTNLFISSTVDRYRLDPIVLPQQFQEQNTKCVDE